jgi:hypothetical protein
VCQPSHERGVQKRLHAGGVGHDRFAENYSFVSKAAQLSRTISAALRRAYRRDIDDKPPGCRWCCTPNRCASHR